MREINQLNDLFLEFPWTMTFCKQNELRLMVPAMSDRFWRAFRRLRTLDP